MTIEQARASMIQNTDTIIKLLHISRRKLFKCKVYDTLQNDEYNARMVHGSTSIFKVRIADINNKKCPMEVTELN